MSSTARSATKPSTSTTTPVRHIAVRTSPIERRGSMRAFERLSGRLLVVAGTTMAVAMTAFICVTAHVLG